MCARVRAYSHVHICNWLPKLKNQETAHKNLDLNFQLNDESRLELSNRFSSSTGQLVFVAPGPPLLPKRKPSINYPEEDYPLLQGWEHNFCRLAC